MKVETIMGALFALKAAKAEDRMGADTWGLVREAIFQLESALVAEGLVVNIEKVKHE